MQRQEQQGTKLKTSKKQNPEKTGLWCLQSEAPSGLLQYLPVWKVIPSHSNSLTHFFSINHQSFIVILQLYLFW